MNESEVLLTEREVARTFDGGDHDDDGDRPDPIRAIETAREYGWLECSYDDPEFTGLNALVANVFSGGSIAESTFVPSFALTHRGLNSHVIDALELVGVEYTVFRERDDGRPTEVRPAEAAGVLGRVLSVLGSPVGPKAHQRLEVPEYLDDAPRAVRELFVYAYLENRAVEFSDKDTLAIMEDRNRTYLEELAELIEDVADAPVNLTERGVMISAEASRNLGTVR